MRSRQPPRWRTAGFTLTEALVATATLAIALGALLMSMAQAMRGVQENHLALLASAAASQELERLRSRPFDQIAAGSFTAALAAELRQIPDASGAVFSCAYNPSTGVCDADGDPNMKQVTVAVSLGGSRAWRLVSLFSNP